MNRDVAIFPDIHNKNSQNSLGQPAYSVGKPNTTEAGWHYNVFIGEMSMHITRSTLATAKMLSNLSMTPP